jgi:hypothetical protein
MICVPANCSADAHEFKPAAALQQSDQACKDF